MRILSFEEIQAALPSIDLLGEIESGFVDYSKGRAEVPPVGELVLEDPPGEVHIKYGYMRDDTSYVIKIASGFYENARLGIPSGDGLMLVFSQETGALESILLDRGFLTDVRTAVAGAVAAKHLAPSEITSIGVIGTGVQARLQVDYLASVTSCRDVTAWGRDPRKLDSYCADMADLGFSVSAVEDSAAVLDQSNLIVTTTPATTPILRWVDTIRHGLHITAVGSDTPSKQELDLETMSRADVLVADSRSQCRSRGEIHHAIASGVVSERDIVELGEIIAGDVPGRMDDSQVTVADLTGVAVQDIKIAQAVVDCLM